MKNKFLQTALPIGVFILLSAISVLSVPEAAADGWIPLVGGFFNATFLSNYPASVPFTILCLAVTLLGMYMILLKTNAVPFIRCMSLFLALLASGPNLFQFNQVYPVLACLVWVQFCLLERQIFVAFLLLSGASLFFAPAIWLVPVVLMLMPFNGMPDQFRVFVTSLSGACLPHLYLLIFRWIKFDDAGVYLYHFYNEAIEIYPPFHSLEYTDYFLILVMFYMLVRAVSFFVRKAAKGFFEYMFKVNLLMAIVTFILFLLFSGNWNMSLLSLAFVPLSILYAYYFKSNEKNRRTNIEYLVLMSSLVLCGLSHLMN
jgi:hypothetical protein